MVLGYYITILILSAICCAIYYVIKRRYYSVIYTMVFLLSFTSQACYVLMSYAENVREALVINRFLYVGGCFLPIVGMFLIFDICQIKLPKWVRGIVLLYAVLVYCFSLTAGSSELFYKSVDIDQRNGVTILIKEYGPMHLLFYIEIGMTLVATLTALVYGWFKKPNISRKSLAIAAFMQVFSIFAFFLGRAVTKEIEWMALADLVDEVGFLLIMNRVGLYQVDSLVSSSILKEGKYGFISLDFKKRYLSSTIVANRFLPELSKNHADHMIEDPELRKLIDSWIDEFREENLSYKHILRRNDSIYLIHVSYLYDGMNRRGYIIEITDDTVHQQHMEGIERYNKNLNRELAAKTELIKELRASLDDKKRG